MNRTKTKQELIEFMLKSRPEFKIEIESASYSTLCKTVRLVKEADEHFRHGPNVPQLRALLSGNPKRRKKPANKPWSRVHHAMLQ